MCFAGRSVELFAAELISKSLEHAAKDGEPVKTLSASHMCAPRAIALSLCATVS